MLKNNSAGSQDAASDGSLANGTSANGAYLNGAPLLEARELPQSSSLAPVVAPTRPNSSPTPNYTGDTVDLGSVLGVLWRRKKLMMATGTIVFLLGVLFTLRQKSVYQATCSILLTTPTDNGPTMTGTLRDLLTATQPRSVGTQLAIMRSYPVQRAAIKRLSPSQQDALKGYYKLDVQPQRDSEAIDLIAESYDPQVAATLANALNSEYMAQYQQQNRAQVTAGTREVADQLAAAKNRLNEAATELKNYKQANRTIDLSEESKARLASINQIEGSLRDLKTERAASLAHIKALSGQVSSLPTVEVLPDRIVRRPEVEALRGELNRIELQLISTLRRYRPGSPEVTTLQTQRDEVRRRLQSVTQTEVSSWTRSVNPVRQGLTQDIARTQAQIWSIDARTQALQQASQQERAKEALLPEREFRLNQLTTEQGVLQQTYEVLNEKYQSLLVSEGAKLTTARVLAPAEVPGTPIRPRRILSLIMSLMLSVAAAVLAAIVIDRMDDRIRSANGAEEAAQLPVLAQVPLVSGEARNSLMGMTDASSPLLESFRLLRTQLMLRSPGTSTPSGLPALTGKTFKSVLITSSREGEGKSFCALNLAIATALSGRKVVLIECDLRRPTLHTLLGVSLERGLTDVVNRAISLSDALKDTGIQNLQVLTAGSATPNSTELLDSEGARQTLRSAIAGADLAILSCPPVLHMADTQIVATIADAALLVVGYEEAERSEVAQTRELLDRTGVQLLGTVLNKVNEPNRSSTAYLYKGISKNTNA